MATALPLLSHTDAAKRAELERVDALLRGRGVDPEAVTYEAEPCELDGFPPEVREAIRKAEEDLRAGRATLVPNEEVVQRLEDRARPG